VRTRIIAWPGNGLQTQSLHVLTLSPGESSASYAFPSSEELVLCLKGAGEITMRGQRIEIMSGESGQWVNCGQYDVALAPCGVRHGIAIADRPGQPDSWPCGFASPTGRSLHEDRLLDGRGISAPRLRSIPGVSA
jgi:hypothetical protein